MRHALHRRAFFLHRWLQVAQALAMRSAKCANASST